MPGDLNRRQPDPPPDPRRDGNPHRPARREPQTSADQIMPSQLHEGQPMAFATYDPEQLWSELPETVRARLYERAGDVFHTWFWAFQDTTYPDHVRGSLLGTGGFWSSRPQLNHTTQRIVHAISGIRVDPSSFHFRTVEGTPARWHDDAPSHSAHGSNAQQHLRSGVNLDEEIAGCIGHLPAEAQVLLQEPFTASEPIILQESFYGYRQTPLRRYIGIVLAGPARRIR